jgi:hypothetical protein
MMKLARKILLGASAAAASMLTAAPASAYYIVYYYGPPYGQIAGAEMYCDDGTYHSGGGFITGVVAYTEYHTGEAPC